MLRRIERRRVLNLEIARTDKARPRAIHHTECRDSTEIRKYSQELTCYSCRDVVSVCIKRGCSIGQVLEYDNPGMTNLCDKLDDLVDTVLPHALAEIISVVFRLRSYVT